MATNGSVTVKASDFNEKVKIIVHPKINFCYSFSENVNDTSVHTQMLRYSQMEFQGYAVKAFMSQIVPKSDFLSGYALRFRTMLEMLVPIRLVERLQVRKANNTELLKKCNNWAFAITECSRTDVNTLMKGSLYFQRSGWENLDYNIHPVKNDDAQWSDDSGHCSDSKAYILVRKYLIIPTSI